MNNFVISLIRTWTPVAVGAVLAWLAARGLHLSPSTDAAAVAAITAGITALYYALIRLAETKFPWLGVLLGHTAKPSYGTPHPEAKAAAVPGAPASRAHP